MLFQNIFCTYRQSFNDIMDNNILNFELLDVKGSINFIFHENFKSKEDQNQIVKRIMIMKSILKKYK